MDGPYFPSSGRLMTCVGCRQPGKLTEPGCPGILLGFVSMADLGSVISSPPRGQSATVWPCVPGKQKWMFTKDPICCLVWPEAAGTKRHLGIPGTGKLCPRRQSRAGPCSRQYGVWTPRPAEPHSLARSVPMCREIWVGRSGGGSWKQVAGVI